MILKNVIDLKKSIEGYRQQMYNLAKIKGITDPETVKISKELDIQIETLQKILADINSQSVPFNLILN